LKLEPNDNLDLVVVGEGIAFEGRRIKPNSLYISWVSREYEDEQGMKMLIDGEEDDVVGYQPEEYAVMITKRATNQSALGIGVVGIVG
jgi:hypothetical protein